MIITDTYMQIFSIILSATLVFLSVITIPIFYRIARNFKADSKEYAAKFDSLQSGFHYKNFISRHWNTITLTRHMLVSLVLVFLRDYNFLQIMILFSFTIIFQCMIIHAWPCENRIDNAFLIFNEVMANVYLYSLMCITDFNESYILFDDIAFCLMIILIVTFVMNLLYGIVSMLISFMRMAKRVLLRIFRPSEIKGRDNHQKERPKSYIKIKTKRNASVDQTMKNYSDIIMYNKTLEESKSYDLEE